MKNEFTKSSDSNELERFREQWKAEISKQHNQSKLPPETSSTSVSDIKKHLEESTEIRVPNAAELTKLKSESTDPETISHKALEIYVKAVTKEREGNLSEG
jgi:hypothetical protein